MKTVYSLKPLENNMALVLGPDDAPITTHWDTEYPPLNKDIAQILADDLNSIYERNFENAKDQVDENEYLKAKEDAELLSIELRESFIYCVLSTFIEAPGDYEHNVSVNAIQWDRVFRLSPGPPSLQIEMAAVEPIKKALKSDWVNLPLNYAQSLEEMEEDEYAEFVPVEIIQEADEILSGLNKYQRFIILLLGKFFENFSVIAVMLFANDMLSSKELLNMYYAFNRGRKYEDVEEEDQVGFKYKLQRLEYLKRFMNLSE